VSKDVCFLGGGAIPSLLAVACMIFGASTDAAAETTKERVLSEGKIVVGMYNQSPWAFKNEQGDVLGFNADVIRAALAPLGVKKLEVIVSQFPAMIPGLQARRFDVVAAGLYITPERCRLVAFSDPDLKLSDTAIVKSGNPLKVTSYADVAKRPEIRMGTTRGSVLAQNAALAGVATERQILFQDNQSVMSALLADRIDVAVFSTATAVAVLTSQKLPGVERVSTFQGYVQPNGQEKVGYSAVAFRLEDFDLRDLYNTQLAELKRNGKMAEIMKRYGFSDTETAPSLSQAQLCAGAN
jgi:polar amino acid transport system substrate-binding protein